MSDVLLGAVIALIGSLGAPWIKDAIERRSRAREQLRADTRGEVLNLIAALTQLQQARLLGPRDATFVRAHSEAAVAGTRLAIVTPARDHHELGRVVAFTIESISNSEHRQAVIAAMQACVTVLEMWARGAIQGKRIGDEYERYLKENLEASATGAE
jgi:hypothetical protein